MGRRSPVPCEPIDLGDGVRGFICSRGRRAKPCGVVGCTNPSVALCDYPLSGHRAGATCDRPLCQKHRCTQIPRAGVKAARPGDPIDYCPTHDELARGDATTPKGAEAGVARGAQLSLGADGREGEGAARPTAEGRARRASQSEAARHGPAGVSASPSNRRVTFPIPPATPTTSCRSCGAPVVFVRTQSGRWMPVEANGDKRGESHFAHCPQAAEHRRPRGER